MISSRSHRDNARDVKSEQIFSLRCHTEQAVHQPARRKLAFLANGFGGAGRDRTDDPLLAKQVLSQLSYGP